MSAAVAQDFLHRLQRDLDDGRLVLPTLPEIALRVRETLEAPDKSLKDVAAVIAQDTAISARLLQVVNSPLQRASRRIESVDMAVTRLGGDAVRSLVIGIAMEQMFQATSELSDRRLREVWRHSTEVAAIAQVLAAGYTTLRPDMAMLAGLVHDIGILPILRNVEDYPELLGQEGLLETLIARYHGKLGARILRHWGLAEDLVKVAFEHENPDYDSPAADYVDLIIVADLQAGGEAEPWHRERDWATVASFAKLGLETEAHAVDMDAAFRNEAPFRF